MKTLTVNVSNSIINQSNPCDVHRCMVAEAIQAKYPEASHIFVDTTTIRLTHKGIRHWFIPPTSVKNFIVAFDQGKKPQPFKFTTSFLAKTKPKGDPRPTNSRRWKDTRKTRKSKKLVKAAFKRVRVNGICNMVKV